MINMPYLILIDIDGTLQNELGEISDKTKQIIQALQNQGHYIVLASGRARPNVLKVAKQLNLHTYCISSNGSELYDIKNDKVIFGYYINKNLAQLAYNLSRKYALKAKIAFDNYELLISKEKSYMYNGFFQNHKIKQIMLIHSNRYLMSFIENYLKLMNGKILNESVALDEDYWFSLSNANASKGLMLKVLANYLNIPLTHTIVIGNDYNDISMFRLCSNSFAVANSCPVLKEHAKYITSDNNHDGVYQALSFFFQ